MTEQKLLKSMLIKALIIVAVFIGAQFAIRQMDHHIFKDEVRVYTYNNNYYQPKDLNITFDNPECLSGEIIGIKRNVIEIKLTGLSAGYSMLQIFDVNTGDKIAQYYYHVSSNLSITNLNTGNFTSYRQHTASMIALMIAISLLLLYGFYICQKELGFSYQSIFYSGFFFWSIIPAVIMTVKLIEDYDMIDMYKTLRNIGLDFIILSSPIILIFAIAMTISNVELIRHERFRIQNALGIGISVALVLGAIIAFVVDAMELPTLGFTMEYGNLIFSIYTSLYCMMECFLLGSIICGFLAAIHEPTYDKDYIIILGCKVKKDGTLYPLIKSRVDRAIEFYQNQLLKTGKKAIFVPSGGQGSDEQISEADAMKRYLVEQGYTEDQIIVENQSRNTKQNMIFSKKLIDEDFETKKTEEAPTPKIVFSTNNFHVFRSGIISRQNQLKTDGMGSGTKYYFWPNAYVREMIGMVTYLWKRLVLICIPIVLFNAIIQFIY